MEFFLNKKLTESAAESVKKERENLTENSRPEEIEKADKTTQKIFDIQKEKQKIIDETSEKMHKIRRGEYTPNKESGQTSFAKFNEEKGAFTIEKEGKEPQTATLGDLITDAFWGKEYELNESTPLEIKEKYYQKVTSIKTSNLFDEQLVLNKLSNDWLGNGKRMAYGAIQEMNEQKMEHSAGLVFEKILKSILTQLQYDIPDWDIKIEKADVVKDVEYKIDFIIKVANRKRGAKIEEKNGIDNPLTLGIQFTLISPSDEKYKDKVWQTEKAKQHLREMKIDDLILISLPTDNREIINKYKTWKELGKPVGGPERLYDTNTKIAILKTVLEKMGLDEVLKDQEEKLKDYYNSKLAPAAENK